MLSQCVVKCPQVWMVELKQITLFPMLKDQARSIMYNSPHHSAAVVSCTLTVSEAFEADRKQKKQHMVSTLPLVYATQFFSLQSWMIHFSVESAFCVCQRICTLYKCKRKKKGNKHICDGSWAFCSCSGWFRQKPLSTERSTFTLLATGSRRMNREQRRAFFT